MGIPISKYIKVSTVTSAGAVGERQFFGLVFTDEVMGATGADATIKAVYDAGKPVAVSSASVTTLFASTSKTAQFAEKYFGYANGPDTLYVAKILAGDASDYTKTYNRAISYVDNFGSFTFLGKEASDAKVKNVATTNESMGFLMVVPLKKGSGTFATDAGTYYGKKGVHLVMADEDTWKTGTDTTDTCNLGAWMPMAWYGSVNYNAVNASDTMDYKKFSADLATVDDGTTKDDMDKKRVNYVGRVQSYGTNLTFYQQGVNADGEDIGNFRDMVWLKSEVEAGWLNLATTRKIPANADGANSVYTMVAGVAESGTQNGCILLEKQLTTTMIDTIKAYTGSSIAATQVQVSGYYVDTKIVKEGDRYVCEYTLVYGKGDHIGKVEGTHYLV